MNRFFVVGAIGGLVVQLGLSAAAEEAKPGAAAVKILQAWQASHAAPCERPLQVICWTPSDREYPAGYKDRLNRMLGHIQSFYADEMERHGLGRLTFGMKRDASGRIVLHEIRGEHPTSHYAKKSGSEIRQECLPALEKAGIDARQATLAIFCNLATWDENELRFTHNSPYYAGGDYRQGTAWQLDSPELDTLNLPKTAPLIRDGQYGRISLGKHNSIFIGGMAHELGHAFGLPHCAERPDESPRGTSLMGSGNRTYGDETRGEGRGSFLPLADALRLASHPLFCNFLEKQPRQPKSTLQDLVIQADGKAIAVAGTIVSDLPVYGVIAYFDPAGNSDYNQTSRAVIPDRNGRFELRCDALTPGKGVLKILPLYVNGALDDGQAQSRMRYSYQVANDGTPQLQAIHLRFALQPLLEALARGDNELASALAAKVVEKDAAALAQALTDATEPTQTPADSQLAGQVHNLTSFKPAAAKVGWLKPVYNRVPEASILLESAGEIFTSGIYAHAPAAHEYSLGKQWDSLKGKVGIATGHPGTVRFTIQGDGVQLWQSPVVRPDELVSFTVSVKGVNRLELIASPTDDGTGGDWGLWLAPTLHQSESGTKIQ